MVTKLNFEMIRVVLFIVNMGKRTFLLLYSTCDILGLRRLRYV